MKPKSSGLAPDVFIKQIENGNIPTVVCIVGEEPYYRDLVRRTLLDAIFTDTPTDSRDISVFEEKTDMKKLDTLINTYPFFSGRTVIFITDKELLNPKAEAEGNMKGQNDRNYIIRQPDDIDIRWDDENENKENMK